jgi:hypothetical protein
MLLFATSMPDFYTLHIPSPRTALQQQQLATDCHCLRSAEPAAAAAAAAY